MQNTRHSRWLICLSGCLLLLAAYNSFFSERRSVPRGYYSGEFCTGNCSGRTVRILDCSNFGFVSPDAGLLGSNSDCGCSPLNFPPLREFPKETAIRWRDEETGKEFSETVNLRGIVPAGVEGVTEFILTSENKWRVRFVPTTRSDE